MPVGIWIVGNIGKQQGSIKWPLLGCYLTTGLHVFGYTTYIWTTLAGIIAFQMKSRSWRRTIREPLPFWKRVLILVLCSNELNLTKVLIRSNIRIISASIYASLWGCYIYFNLKIVTKDGDRIKFRDAAKNFLNSPAVQEFTKNVGKLWEHMLEFGFWSTMQQLIESLDPLGEKHALRVIN